MKKKIALAFIIGLGYMTAQAQEKKYESIYANFQSKGNLNFMNALTLGVKLNTKKDFRKVTLGIAGYYPNFNTINNHSNFNYDYYNTYNIQGDTSSFVSRRLSNGGIGLSIGLSTYFKLFKRINLTSGVTLHNMINIREQSITRGRTTAQHNLGSTFFHEVTSTQSSTKVSYIPVFETYFGAVFTMGEHLQLIPRLNTNISVYEGNALYKTSYNGITAKLTMRPSVMLGYKF